MIKKYKVDKNSEFSKSIILPFYEKGGLGFAIDGLDDKTKRELFNLNEVKVSNKTKEVDLNSLPIYCSVIYLDEQMNIKAIILYSVNKKLYYCFRVVNLDELKLRIQQNYISNKLEELELDVEKSFKKKGVNHYQGIGDFKSIKDINYFDNRYIDNINPRIDKKANTSRLVFTTNNKFTVDFINLIDRKIISIINIDKVDEHVLSLGTMGNVKANRKDCLFVNFSTGSIDYFIYTYRPYFVNHYLLFKNLGNDEYEFIGESICFNKLLLIKDIKDLYFKLGSELASKAFSNMGYDDFSTRYLEFEIDEEIDEEFNSEWLFIDQLKKESTKDKIIVDDKLDSLLKEYGYSLDDNIIYFRDYETIPLACFGDNYIRVKQNRSLTDLTLSNQISLKDLNKINSALINLLQNTPSSRLVALSSLTTSVISQKLNPNDEEQCNIVSEIDGILKSLWLTDKKYPVNYFNDLYKKYTDWKENNKTGVTAIKAKPVKTGRVVVDYYVRVTYHGSIRIDERIGSMSEEDKLVLAKKAYSLGYTSVHFLEKDATMFEFLQYQQNKYPQKTLRLYNDFIYIFSLKPPYDLVTCFPLKENYERYRKHIR